MHTHATKRADPGVLTVAEHAHEQRPRGADQAIPESSNRVSARAATVKHTRTAALCCILLALAVSGQAQPSDITVLSLEQLLDIGIVGASKYEQKQSQVAAAVSVITRQEIRAFGWRTLDEAIASLPGVHTTYDRQYTYLGTRGFGLPGDFNTRILVTINGNRFNDPTYDSGPFGRQFPLDLDLIERIEYIPGPGGAVYGQNAMFGVVNVVTRDGARLDGAQMSATYQVPQAASDGRFTWGTKFTNGLDVVLSASAHRSRGEDRVLDFGSSGIAGLAAGLDGSKGQQFFVRATRGPWSVEHVYGKRNKEDPTGAYLSDPLVLGQYQADSYAVSQLQYQSHLRGESVHLLARAFIGQERYTSQLSYGTPIDFESPGRWRGFEVRVLSNATGAHHLMAGVEGQDNYRIDQIVNNVADPKGDLLIRSPAYRLGIYAQDEWRTEKSLAITVGTRIDRIDAGSLKTSPRAGLIWHAAGSTTLKALYGRAHRAPNAFERDYDDGLALTANPGLRGESIDTLELVADQRIGEDVILRVSTYQWAMKDLVTLGVDRTRGLSQYQSGEKIRARGLEFSADKTFPSGARMRGSVSSQKVSYVSGVGLLNSPTLLGKLNLSSPLPLPGVRAAYEFQYDSSRLSLNGTRLDGYVISNVRIGTGTPSGKFELDVGIYNLFNAHYSHPGADTNWQNALEQDGRSIRVGIRRGF